MELKTILQRIDNLRVELDELRPLDATQEAQVLQKFRLDWNYHSSKIEGNTLTYGETKALLLFGITAQGKPLRHHFEITGHNEAIKWVMDVVANKEPFTENLIRQLHTILLKERYQVDAVTADGKPTRRWIEVGQYKSTPNHVRTITDEIFYFATPEETPSKMHDLINWFRAEVEKDEVNPLILAAEFHYRFIRIHPFDDGNGRVARLLMNFILLMKGLPPVIIKTEDKQNYFAALRQADAGVLNSFTEYIGTNLIHSLELMIKAAKGENIEELDDIDKEIALFKKELKIENPNSKKVMLDKLQNSILDLKQGFAFAAKKQRVNLLDRHFYIDLVFYNRLLKSFVLIDLKNGHLNPKDLEKMRLAVDYYDNEERLEIENRTIGIIIGKLKNDLIVEYVSSNEEIENSAVSIETILPNKKVLKTLLIGR
jgi:Fic family protein